MISVSLKPVNPDLLETLVSTKMPFDDVYLFIYHCSILYPCSNVICFNRYAYSDDGSEEFDKDDTLTLIKPSPMPKDVRGGPETRSLHGGNSLPSEDVEEEKTE